MNIKELEYVVINCKTKKEAIKLCEVFNKLNLTWNGGASYINNDNWDYWQDEMCYSPYDGTCGDKEGFKHLGVYTIKTPKWFIDNFTYTEDKSIIKTLNDYVNGNICMKNDDLLKELETLMNWRNDKTIDKVLNNKITELLNHAQ